MNPQTARRGDPRERATETVAVVILMVLVLFLIIQAIGSPIANVGGLGGSATYSILVFMPVLLICTLAVLGARDSSS
jgi:hypothetical protein